MSQIFTILALDKLTGAHHAMTVSGKPTPQAAMWSVESSGMTPISIEESHQSAATKATALNAANAIIQVGCSSC
jgi:hypothetical protein